MRFQPASFRPAFGRVLTIAMGLVAALGLVGLIVNADVESLLRNGVWFVLLIAVTVALYWVPRVDVREDEVIVRNPLSTWHVPWGEIQRIDTKWALTLFTNRTRIEAWAAPASGRFTVFTLGPDDTRVSESARLAGSIRPGDTLSSESGAAAHHIRRHWETLRDDGLLDQAVEPGALRREWHWRTIAVLSTLATLGLVGLLV
jgi:hypothetical protein